MSTSHDMTAKLVLIGDGSVGKTAMLANYVGDKFCDYYVTTIGIDFKTKMHHHNDKKIKVQIWDTAGQERFRAITHSYYKGAHGYIVVYDVSNEMSFNNVNNWIEQIKQHGDSSAPIILVGNKADLENEKIICTHIGKEKADYLNMEFIEVSAKTGHHINETINIILQKIYPQLQKQAIEQNNTKVELHDVILTESPEFEQVVKKKCCG